MSLRRSGSESWATRIWNGVIDMGELSHEVVHA